MADISELCFVPNRGRSCKGVIWTNLDVTCVITQKDHIESCPVDEHLAYKMEKKAPFSAFSANEVHDVQPPVKAIPKTAQSSSVPANPGPVQDNEGWCNIFGDKEGCKGAVWTDLEVTAVINRKDHVETCQPIPAIHDEEASAASAEPSTSGQFPVFKRVRAAMYKHRAKRFPILPEHRHDLSNSRHILVFATGSNIRLLAASRTWGMDGTFKIVLQWYQKLFTIHAFLAGKLVPAVYCLCTDKDIPTYGFILSKSGITGNPQRQS
ncbi:hypothetical protein T07_15031 [Trichinella nelsoni]|uniref:MULE transposase domain-containing protein n=1 Tax=Trichinella nelsoni TaxID=6336 RepID=A0A0V0S841_9BILA|nr:hypothetical protein T07_15031 [Trichinella nelsoni]